MPGLDAHFIQKSSGGGGGGKSYSSSGGGGKSYCFSGGGGNALPSPIIISGKFKSLGRDGTGAGGGATGREKMSANGSLKPLIVLVESSILSNSFIFILHIS